MKIRFAYQNDKKEVIDLLEGLSDYLGQKGILRADQIYDEVISREDIKLFVAEENGRIIAVASFYILPCIRHNYRRGHIEEIVVAKNARGKGVGTRLIEAIKRFCIEKNIPVFKVETGNGLIDTHKFYEKTGGRSNQKVYKFEINPPSARTRIEKKLSIKSAEDK